MVLTYKNNKLCKLCEDSQSNKELIKKYGSDVAIKLPKRIVQLKSFACLADVPVVPPFRRHKLSGNLKNLYAININDQYRLIFRQVENNIIVESLKDIKEVEIMEVSKHYE